MDLTIMSVATSLDVNMLTQDGWEFVNWIPLERFVINIGRVKGLVLLGI